MRIGLGNRATLSSVGRAVVTSQSIPPERCETHRRDVDGLSDRARACGPKASRSPDRPRPLARFVDLHGGANNAVFRVDVPAGNFLLKQYFAHPDDDRDRLGAEVAFCQFAWRHGIHVPPRFVADSP